MGASKSPSGKVNLEEDTKRLLQGFAQQNSNVKLVGQPSSITVGGSPALISRLTSDSPYANTREVDVVVSVDRGAGLFYMVCAAPEPDFPKMEPVFQQIVKSLRFK